MTTKEEVQKLLNVLPDNSSIEDIMYELYFKQKVDRGLKNIDNNEVVSNEEMLNEISRWLRK